MRKAWISKSAVWRAVGNRLDQAVRPGQESVADLHAAFLARGFGVLRVTLALGAQPLRLGQHQEREQVELNRLRDGSELLGCMALDRDPRRQGHAWAKCKKQPRPKAGAGCRRSHVGPPTGQYLRYSPISWP